MCIHAWNFVYIHPFSKDATTHPTISRPTDQHTNRPGCSFPNNLKISAPSPPCRCFCAQRTALDVAVTAPQRPESLREASQHPTAGATAYAQLKAEHLRTADVYVRGFCPYYLKARELGPLSLAKFSDFSPQREGEPLQELCVAARRARSGPSDPFKPAAALLLSADGALLLRSLRPA